MLQAIITSLCRIVFLPYIHRVERKIGYRLAFPDISTRFIPSIVSWPMTEVWRDYGLDIEAGMNYWTIGAVQSGISSRYDRNAPEYQAWLGGYLVKLPPGRLWRPEDHIKLALADQDSWLLHRGDPNPASSMKGHEFTTIDTILIGPYTGTIYETGGTTHSDVGDGYDRSWPYFSIASMITAALMNILRPGLRLTGAMMRPQKTDDRPYETLDLRVYFAIFELENNAHAILYGNGTLIPQASRNIVDTLPAIADDLLRTIRACEIIKLNGEMSRKR